MFGRKHAKKTVHFDYRRDFVVGEDGTLHAEIPLVTGTAVEFEVRYLMAYLLRHFADQLAAQVQPEPQRPSEEIIDAVFHSDLQSGSN